MLMRWVKVQTDDGSRVEYLVVGTAVVGMVERFYPAHPTYGTNLSGRTGPVAHLKTCKRQVVKTYRKEIKREGLERI